MQKNEGVQHGVRQIGAYPEHDRQLIAGRGARHKKVPWIDASGRTRSTWCRAMKAALLLVKDPGSCSPRSWARSGGATRGRVAAARSSGDRACSPGLTASVPPAFPASAPGVPWALDQGPGSRILQSKTPGRWIVDAAKAKDSDTDSWPTPWTRQG